MEKRLRINFQGAYNLDSTNIEERLNQIEIKNKYLEHEVHRLQAFVEIQNLMSKYEYFHASENHQETADMFTKNCPDVRAEMQWGVYEGNESIQRMYVDYHTDCGQPIMPGKFGMLPVVNPLIEVAKDCQTAKGMWISIGFVHMPGRSPEDKPETRRAWCKYGIDFKKEDGVWKFWHVQVYDIMFVSWRADSLVEHKPQNRQLPPEIAPDRPPTYRWNFSPTSVVENVPPPPEPYDTFDEKESMTTFGRLGYKTEPKN